LAVAVVTYIIFVFILKKISPPRFQTDVTRAVLV